MSPRIALAVAGRVLTQLRHDPRTVALLVVVPSVLVVLLRYVFDGRPEAFQLIGPGLVGLFPLISMFLVSSITVLRERTSGTLERLLTMPLHKLDILAGYGLAFALLATVQAAVVSVVAFGLLGLDTAGSPAAVGALAIGNALLGMALGLLVSAFAATEFQAVQFMPAFVLPQLLLCGLIVSRADLSAAWPDLLGAAVVGLALQGLRAPGLAALGIIALVIVYGDVQSRLANENTFGTNIAGTSRS